MPVGIYVRTPEMETGKYIRTKEHNRAHTKQFFCDIKGCNEKHLAKGLCRKHWEEQYRIDNKKHIAKRKQRWNKKWVQTLAGRANIKASRHNHRTLTRGLTKAIVQRVYEANIVKYGQLTCCLCFKPIKFGEDSLEHLTPLTREGTNNYDNLGIAHLNCNIRKHTMTLDEWFAKQEVN